MEAVSSRTRIPIERAVMWKTRSSLARPGSILRGSSATSGPGAPSRTSAEAAIDVVLRSGIYGVPEHLLGRRRLDDDPRGLVLCKEERTLLRDAGRLLHVVGDDHDRHCLSQLLDGLL